MLCQAPGWEWWLEIANAENNDWIEFDYDFTRTKNILAEQETHMNVFAWIQLTRNGHLLMRAPPKTLSAEEKTGLRWIKECLQISDFQQHVLTQKGAWPSAKTLLEGFLSKGLIRISDEKLPEEVIDWDAEWDVGSSLESGEELEQHQQEVRSSLESTYSLGAMLQQFEKAGREIQPSDVHTPKNKEAEHIPDVLDFSNLPSVESLLTHQSTVGEAEEHETVEHETEEHETEEHETAELVGRGVVANETRPQESTDMEEETGLWSAKDPGDARMDAVGDLPRGMGSQPGAAAEISPDVMDAPDVQVQEIQKRTPEQQARWDAQLKKMKKFKDLHGTHHEQAAPGSPVVAVEMGVQKFPRIAIATEKIFGTASSRMKNYKKKKLKPE